jgi:hypothetical protein
MTDELPPFFVRKNPTLQRWELWNWSTRTVVLTETESIHYHHLLIQKDKMNEAWAKEQAAMKESDE